MSCLARGGGNIECIDIMLQICYYDIDSPCRNSNTLLEQELYFKVSHSLWPFKIIGKYNQVLDKNDYKRFIEAYFMGCNYV